MKWVLASAALLYFPLFGTSKTTEKPSSTPSCIPYDADLFRKNEQIYALNGEFLYWAVGEGALDYVQQMRHDAWGPTDCYAQGDFEHASYGIDPGFRLGLTYFRAPNYWEVRWQYTRMSNQGHNVIHKPSPDLHFITGTWPQVTTLPIASATSSIHLHYNVFDMLVDRVFFPNPHLRLRIMGGASAAWMNQDWKVRYTDSIPNSTTIRNQWHFAGGGLKMATMVDWYWTHDLYMTALSSFGLLVGSYSNQARQTTTVVPGAGFNPSVPLRDAHYHDVRAAPTAQMLFGPSWQKCYPRSRIELFAGFETNIWFNLQEIYRSTSGSPSAAKETWINTGLLLFYGLTTRATLDF